MPRGASLALVDSRWTPTPTETIPEKPSPYRHDARPTLRAIREIVCAALAIADHQIQTRANDPRVAAARGSVAWVAYANGYDIPEIAAELHRESGTIHAMIVWRDRLIDANPKIADRMIGIAALVEKSILR